MSAVHSTATAAAAAAARDASRGLAVIPGATRAAAIRAAANALQAATSDVLAANAADVAAARAGGVSAQLLDRLALTESRVAGMVAAMHEVAAQPDPIGEVLETWERPNGLRIVKRRVPLGVIAVIYEARPNVTSDVVALCLMSGNSVLLRGSSTSLKSNRAIVGAMLPALRDNGIPDGAVALVEDTSRDGARELMRMTGAIDLLIPRGGRALIDEIRENARVPFVIDGDGNCHVYVDAAADLEMAASIVINAKTSRPTVCNAAEKLLVHEAVAHAFVPRIVAQLRELGVEVRGDEATVKLADGVVAATDDDWDREYLGLVMACRIVDDINAAISHIQRHSSGHTEAIVTADSAAADTFIAGCPSAVVMVNASTRFTDGGEFGFGTEVGNSTQRLHARGPMGVRELTTYRTEVWGDGQIRV